MPTITEKSLIKFRDYLNEFYGIDGIYNSDRNLTLEEVKGAVKQIDNWGGGDSIDREKARDILFTEKELNKMFA